MYFLLTESTNHSAVKSHHRKLHSFTVSQSQIIQVQATKKCIFLWEIDFKHWKNSFSGEIQLCWVQKCAATTCALWPQVTVNQLVQNMPSGRWLPGWYSCILAIFTVDFIWTSSSMRIGSIGNKWILEAVETVITLTV